MFLALTSVIRLLKTILVPRHFYSCCVLDSMSIWAIVWAIVGIIIIVLLLRFLFGII